MESTHDTQFLKNQLEAAKYYLILGNVKYALHFFNKCMESCVTVFLDQSLRKEASVGLQNATKVAECIDCSAVLLEERTPNAALTALKMITEGLLISSCSEKLLELKAEALFLLQKYEEVIQLCELTISFPENNLASDIQSEELPECDFRSDPLVKHLKLCFLSKSNFYLGRLGVALDLLKNLEEDEFIKEKCKNKILESSFSLAATIRKLLHYENAGNKAFQLKKYAEALENYNSALSINVESRPFVAVCLCKRGVCHQKLGQIIDAIADCSRAMTLDRNYAEVVLRRAMYHETIRDYQQAVLDLQCVVSILENDSDEQYKKSCRAGGSNVHPERLTYARRKILLMEEESKKGDPLNVYLILGVKPSDEPSEIKKAYKNAALRHHPDKAGQFFATSESIDEGRLWNEISQEVLSDSERLFKMIGEAYSILSDSVKRSEYDRAEKQRKASEPSECDLPNEWRMGSEPPTDQANEQPRTAECSDCNLDEELNQPFAVSSSMVEKNASCRKEWHEMWRIERKLHGKW